VRVLEAQVIIQDLDNMIIIRGHTQLHLNMGLVKETEEHLMAKELLDQGNIK
jgi:hypothetical protein